ncbi:MAG: hypothetical protein LH606_21120 [Cytophagaceae bacterium]|nr:hypothetical protein [Cytophagaceae bacterium]
MISRQFKTTPQTPVRSLTVKRFAGQSLLFLLFIALISCSQNAQSVAQPGETEAWAKPKKVRINVGEIKEIRLRSSADTTLQVLSTSENPEVVDVSRKQAPQESTPLKPGRSVPVVFLLKGVTAGTAKVILSEKATGLNAPEKIRKTYLVQVVNK